MTRAWMVRWERQALQGLTAVIVAACGEGTGPQSLTLNGFVKDLSGEPIGGAAVVVSGKDPVVTTASGGFSVPDVRAPYDISLILSAERAAVTYRGLTRPDPTLLFLDTRAAENSATISGTVPVVAQRTVLVFFVSGGESWDAIASPTTGAFRITVRWFGPAASRSGQLYVLRWAEGADFLPALYDGFASRSLTVSASGTFAENNFAAGELTNPPEQSISGTVAVPSDYTLKRRSLWLMIDGSATILRGQLAPISPPFAYTVPLIPTAQFAVRGYAEQPASDDDSCPVRCSSYFKSGISAGASGVVVPLERAPQTVLPVDNATNVDVTTTFSWSQGGGEGINVVTFIPAAPDAPLFFVLTIGTSTAIPNLAAQGLALPIGADYVWYVERFFPVASIDAAASDAFAGFLQFDGGDFGNALSEIFRFSTGTAASVAVRGGEPRVPTPPRVHREWSRRHTP